MRRKGFVLLPIIVIIALVGALGYFIYQNTQLQKSSGDLLKPSPTADLAANLPLDWTYKQSSICNVKFPLPPKKVPYYSPYDPNRQPSVTSDESSGRFWQFEEYEASMFLFKTTSRMLYRTPEEASGYMSGDVEVICTPNTAGYTTQTLMAKLESDLSGGSNSDESVGIKSKRSGTMWGQSVMIIKFQGGMFDNSDHYIFATNKNLYLVRKISQSQSQIVKETTDKIFESLQFITD